MGQFIDSLSIAKDKNERYKLKATLPYEDGSMDVEALITIPRLEVNVQDETPAPSKNFNQFILNRSASFHIIAEALVNHDNNNSLFTCTVIPDKKEKTYTPKKYRKYNKKKNQS